MNNDRLIFSNPKDIDKKEPILPNDFFPTEPTKDEKETSEIIEEVFKDLYPSDKEKAKNDKLDKDSGISKKEKP